MLVFTRGTLTALCAATGVIAVVVMASTLNSYEVEPTYGRVAVSVAAAFIIGFFLQMLTFATILLVRGRHR